MKAAVFIRLKLKINLNGLSADSPFYIDKGGSRYEEEIHPLNFVVFYKRRIGNAIGNAEEHRKINSF